MRKLNIIATKLPKKLLEDTVRAWQLYRGSDNCKLKDQQKLYNRAMRLTESIANKMGMDIIDVQNQINAQVDIKGKIVPIPGKDI